jgi:cytochrome c5
MKHYISTIFTAFVLLITLAACEQHSVEGSWEYTADTGRNQFTGIMKLEKENGAYTGIFRSFETGDYPLENISFNGKNFKSEFEMYDVRYFIEGVFDGANFTGTFSTDKVKMPMTAVLPPEPSQPYKPAPVQYILAENEVKEAYDNIDHGGIIDDFNLPAYQRGERIYNNVCINCHGTPEVEGSIPMSHKFWSQPFKAGNDPFSMYQTISKGYGSMPPQLTLTPQEKYDVIVYIRENYIRKNNPSQYFTVTPGYLSQLPKGNSRGPEVKPYHPWADMNYGNFFINTYELADSATGIPRYHSPGPTPFPDEDYRKNNFAYKGIAVRLDKGEGGVSTGKSWMMFDHDLMRVAGGWTGKGFIDWEGILLNDNHETYPRNIGTVHFETPVGPGWANPATGSFDDPRFTARDGRKFGPLPKAWADYRGLYYYDDKVVISYTVGKTKVLEMPGVEISNAETIFTRSFNIGQSPQLLKTRVAVAGTSVAVAGSGVAVEEENGFVVLKISPAANNNFKVFITKGKSDAPAALAKSISGVEDLQAYTKGGTPHYAQIIKTNIIKGKEDGLIAADELTPPYDNPWKSRMKLSGIDFMKDPNIAVVCTSDGDVWKITGLTNTDGTLSWKRIAAGLFQPLGIKVLNEKIYVICRDQLVRLQDLNGDEETDFYESFNHDHQVTDHFHEFAMGLQADKAGNLYYAKSGRHAREALIPQHGTLLKVSSDGATTEIIATGFRAANGVCLNPDGSFIVTDQQGYWNPMNRINWIEGKKKFYGNMWGYNPPKDSSSTGMEQPLVWVDMEYDRSPSELLWVDSKKWGPLDKHLLSLSYGFGKIQLVLFEEVNGQKQGGVIDIPGLKFLTGVMRGRFNPGDGNMYLCGMSAWGTNQMMKGGALYRLRYTGKPLPLPVASHAEKDGVRLVFANTLDEKISTDLKNYEVKTWDIKRSRKYGSARYNTKTLDISGVQLSADKKSVKLIIPSIQPVDIMTIGYDIKDANQNVFKGTLQQTVYRLGK